MTNSMVGDYTQLPKPKPAHNNQRLPPCTRPLDADMVYVWVRDDGKLYAPQDSLHDAAWLRERILRRSNKREWLTLLHVPRETIAHRVGDMVLADD